MENDAQHQMRHKSAPYRFITILLAAEKVVDKDTLADNEWKAFQDNLSSANRYNELELQRKRVVDSLAAQSFAGNKLKVKILLNKIDKLDKQLDKLCTRIFRGEFAVNMMKVSQIGQSLLSDERISADCNQREMSRDKDDRLINIVREGLKNGQITPIRAPLPSELLSQTSSGHQSVNPSAYLAESSSSTSVPEPNASEKSYDKPKYFTSFISAIAALVIFSITYLLAYFILAFLVNFILDLPILGFILTRLLLFRGDSTASFVKTFAPLISAAGTLLLISTINKHEPTFKLTCTITGIVIMIIHALSAIINLLTGVGIWANIMQFVAGYIIFSGRK